MPTFNIAAVVLRGKLCMLAKGLHNSAIFWRDLTGAVLSLIL
jgi:hypothetical protein